MRIELDNCEVTFSEKESTKYYDEYNITKDTIRIFPNKYCGARQISVRCFDNGRLQIAIWSLVDKETVVFDNHVE